MVKNLKVVNDAAERGVQFATDYKDDAKLDLRYQNLLAGLYRKDGSSLRI